jgi:hypothetical protein
MAGWDTGEASLSSSSFTFAVGNWDTFQTLTLTGLDDDSVDGNTVFNMSTTAASSSDTNFHGAAVPDVVGVTNLDGSARSCNIHIRWSAVQKGNRSASLFVSRFPFPIPFCVHALWWLQVIQQP